MAETYQVRLPNGKVVTKRFEGAPDDKTLRQAFGGTYKGAGINAALAQVVRPPQQSLEDYWKAKLGDQGSLSNYKPSITEKAQNGIATALHSLGMGSGADRFAKRAMAPLNDWTPFGDVASFTDGARDVGQGNYASGAGNMLLGAIGAVPGVGDVAAKLAKKADIGRLYHGSNELFDEFDLSRAGSNQEGLNYPMAFLSASPEEAAVYGKNVMEFEPSFTNPLEIKASARNLPMNEWEVQKLRALKTAKDNGHDAIILDNGSQKLVVALDAAKLRRVP